MIPDLGATVLLKKMWQSPSAPEDVNHWVAIVFGEKNLMTGFQSSPYIADSLLLMSYFTSPCFIVKRCVIVLATFAYAYDASNRSTLVQEANSTLV